MTISRCVPFLLLLALLPLLATAARLPLTFETLDGCNSTSGWVRLNSEYRQAGAAPIVIEAEEPTSLALQEAAFRQGTDGFLGEEPGASCGRYIAFVERAEYALHVATPGAYRVWYRAWFPWKGGWNHKEQIIGQLDERQVVDCNAFKDEQTNHWMWVQGPTYTLAQGRQVWELSYNAGCRLDQVVFTADMAWTPPADQPVPGVKVTTPVAGTVVTRIVKPAAVKAWGALEYRCDPRGGTVDAAYSADDGKSWQPMPANNNLSALPARHDGTDTLRFRFTFHPAPDGRSPVVQSARVTYESGRVVATPPDEPNANWMHTDTVPLIARNVVGSAYKRGGQAGRYDTGTMAMQPDTAGCYWLEAETPTPGEYANTNDAAQTLDGAIGACLFEIPQRPLAARYDLQVPADGEYALYARVRFPYELKGNSTTAYVALDGGATQGFALTGSFKPNTWVWAKAGRTMTLSAGLHNMRYYGGIVNGFLDRFCLAPVTAPAPQGDGAPASTTLPSKACTITYFPVRPPRGASWSTLRHSEGYRFEVSTDNGTSWQETTDIARFGDAELLIRASGQGSIIAEALFQGRSGIVQCPLTLGYALIDTDGSLYGLWHGGRGEWIVPPGTRAPAFALAYQVPGVARLDTLSSDDAVLTSVKWTEAGWQWMYELLDGGIIVTTTLESPFIPKPDQHRWQIHVQNHTDLDIRQVQFPILPRLTLDGERMDDTLVFPEAFGCTLKNPYAMGSFSYNPIVWPGTASMAWTDLSDQAGGVYLAAEHRDMLGVEFNLAPNKDRASIRAGFTKQICIGPGESWTGDYRLVLHGGDWHAGADLYRKWADSWMDKPVYPAWLKNCDAYLAAEGGSGRIYSRYATHAAPLMQWMGVNYTQMWAGTADGEFCGLHPALNPRFGRTADARAAHDAARKQGHHYTYYINDQGWYPGFSTTDFIGYEPKSLFKDGIEVEPPDFFDRWGLRNFGGKLTQYGAGVGYTTADRAMCAASTGWRNHFIHWLGQVRPGDYRCDGSYIDQAACLFHYCYGEDHGHGKQHGAWGLGNYQMMKAVTAEAKKRDRDAVLGMEGVTDVQAPYGWGLWVNNGIDKGEVFLYTRPQSLLFRGTSNGHAAYYFRTMQDAYADVFLYNRFDGGAFQPWFRNLLALRRQVKDWMYAGRFMDVQGLRVTGGPVEARWFKVEEKNHHGAVINLHNWTGANNVRVQLDYAGAQAIILYTDAGEVSVIDATKGVNFTAPTATSATALVIAKAPANTLLRAAAEWKQENDVVLVTLANAGTKARSVSVKLANARAFSAAPGAQRVTVPALGTTKVTLPLPNRAGLAGVTEAKIAVSGLGTLTTPVMPVLVNGSFETDVNGDRVPDAWGTWTTMAEHMFMRFVPTVSVTDDLDGKACAVQPFTGKTCLQVPPAFDFTGTALDGSNRRVPMHWNPESSQRVFLTPGARYRLRVAIRADAGTKGKVYAQLFGLRLGPKDASELNGQWKTYDGVVTVPADIAGFATIILQNETKTSVWFDAVELQALAAQEGNTGPAAK
jgi:hypothetical protein